MATIEVLSDNKLLIGGGITQYGNINIGKMCRLNSDGTFDSSWNSGGTSFNSTSEIYDIEVDGSNNIWVGGTFESYNGTSSLGLIKLNSDGSINTSFGTNLKGISGGTNIQDIQLLSDNSVLLGGAFTGYTGTNASSLIKLNSDNSLNTTFTTNFYNIGFTTSFVYGIGVQSTGKIILVGEFIYSTYTNRVGIIRINSDGTIDNTFNVISGLYDILSTNILVLSDDKFYSNLFERISNPPYEVPLLSLNRYNSNGTVDNTFTTGVMGNSNVFTATNEGLISLPNGDVIYGGSYQSVNLYPVYNIAAFSSNGTVKNCNFIQPPFDPTPTPTPTQTQTPTGTLLPVGVGIYSGATYATNILACNSGQYPNGTVYILPGHTLSNGDILYTNYNLSGPFVGNDLYYRLYSGGQFYAATISAGGYVSNLILCSSIPPTPTPTPTTSLPLLIANGEYICSTGVEVCNGEFTILSVSGGSGAPYQTSYVLEGNAPSWNNYPSTSTYYSLCGGSFYVLSLKDSAGNIRTSNSVEQCVIVPTPTPTVTVTPSSTGNYGYYIMTDCQTSETKYSQSLLYGTYNSGDRVQGSFGYFYVITGFTPSYQAITYSISATGNFGCP